MPQQETSITHVQSVNSTLVRFEYKTALAFFYTDATLLFSHHPHFDVLPLCPCHRRRRHRQRCRRHRSRLCPSRRCRCRRLHLRRCLPLIEPLLLISSSAIWSCVTPSSPSPCLNNHDMVTPTALSKSFLSMVPSAIQV